MRGLRRLFMQPVRSALPPPPPLPDTDRQQREAAQERIPRKQQVLARLVEAYSAADQEYRRPRPARR